VGGWVERRVSRGLSWCAVRRAWRLEGAPRRGGFCSSSERFLRGPSRGRERKAHRPRSANTQYRYSYAILTHRRGRREAFGRRLPATQPRLEFSLEASSAVSPSAAPSIIQTNDDRCSCWDDETTRTPRNEQGREFRTAGSGSQTCSTRSHRARQGIKQKRTGRHCGSLLELKN